MATSNCSFGKFLLVLVCSLSAIGAEKREVLSKVPIKVYSHKKLVQLLTPANSVLLEPVFKASNRFEIDLSGNNIPKIAFTVTFHGQTKASHSINLGSKDASILDHRMLTSIAPNKDDVSFSIDVVFDQEKVTIVDEAILDQSNLKVEEVSEQAPKTEDKVDYLQNLGSIAQICLFVILVCTLVHNGYLSGIPQLPVFAIIALFGSCMYWSFRFLYDTYIYDFIPIYLVLAGSTMFVLMQYLKKLYRLRTETKSKED